MHMLLNLAASSAVLFGGSRVKKQKQKTFPVMNRIQEIKDRLWNNFFCKNIVCCYDRLVRGSHTLVAHQHRLCWLLPHATQADQTNDSVKGFSLSKSPWTDFSEMQKQSLPPAYLSWAMTHRAKDQPQLQPHLPLRLKFLVFCFESESVLQWLTFESLVTINGCWLNPVRANFLLLACFLNLIDRRQDIELRSCRMRGWVKARRTTTTWEGFMSKRKLSKCLHENVWDISTAKKKKKYIKLYTF